MNNCALIASVYARTFEHERLGSWTARSNENSKDTKRTHSSNGKLVEAMSNACCVPFAQSDARESFSNCIYGRER